MSFTQEDMDKLFPRKSVEFLQAENSTLKEELKAINAALDDPRTDLTMAACEVIVALKEQVAQLQDSSIDKLSLVVFGEGDWFNLMPASLHDQLCEALAAFKGESDDTRST